MKKKRHPRGTWRFYDTYIKVKGSWTYYYRAVDRYGGTIDFLLTAKRDTKATLRYLRKVFSANGKLRLINIDQSGANNAAIKMYNFRESTRIKIRRCKCLNNIVEQDHRLIKRITRSMLGFKNLCCAQATLLTGNELIRMLRKGQMRCQIRMSKTYAEVF